MSRDTKQDKSLLDRRTLLRGGAAAAFAAPIGVFGAQAFPFRAAPGIDYRSSRSARHPPTRRHSTARPEN